MMIRILLALCLIATPCLSQIKLIKDSSGHSPTNPEPCLITCAGSTGAGVTHWIQHADHTLETHVDITQCGFVTTPVITTSLAGIGYHDTQKGTSAPWNVNMAGFTIAVIDDFADTSVSRALQYLWHVNWIAVGYTCA